ncbi:putative amidase-like protein [Laceyella sediminis]|uniref:Amidase-like protein n=1 Tax=Laceyella sediminis TaxID=573074 RepID=A0ABX5EJL0_9BACL|nr:amidase domain-containing protein [Laceyella sediminis]PRZ11889.1 putative amidase-like protein [Laceyella sediminis]
MNRIMISSMMILALIASGCSSTDAQQGQETKKQPAAKTAQSNETELSPVDVVETASQEVAKKSAPVSQKTQPNKNDLKHLEKVSYYQKANKQKPAAEQKALAAIDRVAKQHKVNVKPDVNNSKFREMVVAAATNIQSLTPDEAKAVIDYAKKVDAYENSKKNEIIKQMKEKVNMGVSLTQEDKALLDAVTPIKPGQKLQGPPPSKDKPGQGGLENPGPQQPKEEQPGKPVQQEPKPGQPNQPVPQEPKPGQPNQPVPQQPKPGNQYDPIKARDYAYQWWNKRNNEQYNYYSRVSGGCYNCWADCTNFVSQAIKAGGIQERRNGTYWYYSDTKPSYAWGVANSFYKHFKERAQEVKSWKDLSVGDVVNVDFDHDGDIEHSAIVTKVGMWEVYITQHTSDKKDAPLSPWLRAGYDVYAWKMSTANLK